MRLWITALLMSVAPGSLMAQEAGPAAGVTEVGQGLDQDGGQRADVTIVGQASENTGAYGVDAASAAARLNLSQRETPQSISVVTRAQIDDFQLDDVNSLLATTTGINVQNVETDRTYYSARGFDITNFQLDGVGLPFAYGLQNGGLDTATYDRVEVLRGANGLTSLTGNPSATINFVRKRPGDRFAVNASAQYGSFDTWRVEGDISAPITDGVAARVAGAYQDGDGYLDRHEVTRSVIYGIVTADLGPQTKLSAGYQRSLSDSTGNLWGALPLIYADGTPTDYDRSTSTSADWSYWKTEDQQFFGDITHAFGGGWSAKLSVLHRLIDEDSRLFYVYGLPDRETGDGLFAYPGAFSGPTREWTVDAYVSGPVTLFGRAHDVVIGVNRGTADLRQYSSYPPAGAPLPGDSAFDGSFPLPVFPARDLSADFETRRESAYGLIRLNPADQLKVMLGGSVVHAVSDGTSYGVRRDYSLTRVLPFAGATFDFTPNLSAYASYTKIFNPQVEIDANLRVLPPIEGDNLEAGIKGEWMGGALYASVAIFRARQDNTAESLGFDPTSGQTLYTTVDATSEGIEFDLGGRLAPGLNATAGLTFLRIEDEAGARARTYVPRRTGRLNVTYNPPAFDALTVGASMQYQSAIDRLIAGFDYQQDSYALVDLMARYAITPQVSVTGNVRNVTNAKYVTSLYWEQAFYGAPRTASVTLGVKF